MLAKPATTLALFARVSEEFAGKVQAGRVDLVGLLLEVDALLEYETQRINFLSVTSYILCMVPTLLCYSVISACHSFNEHSLVLKRILRYLLSVRLSLGKQDNSHSLDDLIWSASRLL